MKNITPNDLLAGRREAIWADRDRKLEAAHETRRTAALGEAQVAVLLQ
jgi:hypothetical protein